MKKLLYTLTLLCFCISATAQNAKYETGKPNDANYRYLDQFHNLKEYIDHDKYPNFKLGIGTIVNDYLNDPLVRDMTNNNFTETVAGNAMKMASCVDNNGNMNFTTVKKYVNAATDAGLNVYGHTLAWHSQQPNGWLRSLIADKPAPELTDGDVTMYVPIASKDFRTQQNVGWNSSEGDFGFKLNFDSTNGLNIHCSRVNPNFWDVQFLAVTDIPTELKKTYRMTMNVRGSKAGILHTRLGEWENNNGHYFEVGFTTDWQEVSVDYTPNIANCFYLIQCGDFEGDIYIKDIRFDEVKMGKTVTDDRRCLKVHATEKYAEVWDNQMWLVPGSFSANSTFVFTADVRADKQAIASTQIHTTPGNYVHYEALGNIPFTTEWKTITVSGKFEKAGESIALNLSELSEENNYYFDNVSLKINGVEKIKNGNFEGTDVSSFRVREYNSGTIIPAVTEGYTYVYVPTSIPLSNEERHDRLVAAMDKWIKGMMEACEGKVKAWDVVNEAISGGGNDGSGNYTLQHSEGYNPNGTWDVGGDAFYWQDYMGDLEYVRQAVRLARKYGPEDVKLFINDYNLESDWDQNKKLKSLINWIKKWESDGTTYIDGIGTQMHISFYKNSGTQTSKMNAITNMFNLMAATGKYVRVSELDMGYVDTNGNSIPTTSMTESQHKEMADFYEWIIKEYLRIIPPAQQWGICQWCPTDAPSYSGWRGGEPVGIWDLDYYRKHVYAGFVRGLGGEVKTPDHIRSNTTIGKLGVVCLPYASTIYGAKAYEFVGVDNKENPSAIWVEPVTGILEAGKPYVFKTTANTDVTFYRTGSYESSIPGNENGLVGVFAQTTKTGNNYAVVNGKFRKAGDYTATVLPYRAYLDMDNAPEYSSNSSEVKNCINIFDESETTDIQSIFSQKQSVGVIYDLNGRKVSNPSKGIYIKDGKKFVK